MLGPSRNLVVHAFQPESEQGFFGFFSIRPGSQEPGTETPRRLNLGFLDYDHSPFWFIRQENDAEVSA